MDELRQAFEKVDSTLQDMTGIMRANTHDLRMVADRTATLQTDAVELRGILAGIGNAVQSLFDRVKVLEGRMDEVEKKLSA